MREFINKAEGKIIKSLYKKDNSCCYLKLNGKKLKTKEAYYEKLSRKLQLNDTFSNNLNAYSDMMRDPYTYYNKDKIVVVIKNYTLFLCDDPDKSKIEKIFDQDIIPFFREEILNKVQKGKIKEYHIYCIE